MALLFMDGFDLQNGISTRNWYSSQQGSSVAYVAGALGGSAYRIQAGTAENDNYYMSQALPSTYAEVVWGFRFNCDILKSDQNFFRFGTSAGTEIAFIRINSITGFLSVYNSSSTLVATGWRPVLANGYHYLEFRLKINGASGECQVMIDGTEEVATTVANFGSTNISQLQIYARAGSAGTRTLYMDDIYALDTTGGAPRNTFLGDCRVEGLLPTSDGATLQWTPNSGAVEYTQIDDNPFTGDTDYVYSSTPNDVSTYGFPDVSGTGPTVYAVQTLLAARKDDTGLRQIQPVIRQGGTDYVVGAAHTLSTSYVVYADLLPQDPVAAEWTAANVNGDEYGVKVIT